MSLTTKEKILPINLLGLKKHEEKKNGITVVVNDGLITCSGSAELDTNIDLYLIGDGESNGKLVLNGTYNFSMQNVKRNTSNNAFPSIYLIEPDGKRPKHLYGEGSYLVLNTEEYIKSKSENTETENLTGNEGGTKSSEVTFNLVRLFFAKGLSFDNNELSFNLMLQEGKYRKVYVPYNNVDKNAFWAEYGYDVINPRLFCAVGNGEVDDTKALQDAFDYAIENKMKMVLDREATYLVSTTLNLKGADIFFDGQGATIKMHDEPSIENKTENNSESEEDKTKENPKVENVIYIEVPPQKNGDEIDGISDYNGGQYFYRVFENVKIDCNKGVADTGINILDGGKTKYSNIMICDPTSYGIYFKGGHEAVFDNIHAVRSKVNDTDENGNYISRESVGMMIKSSDIYVHDCVIVDFKTGIRTNGGDNHFARCHVWVTYTPNIISESISFDIAAGYSTFTQCIADSTRYGWVLRSVARVYLSNCCNAYNKYYKDTYGEPVLFYFDKSELTGHYFKGETLYISSSHFKTRDGLNCHFDNLTEYENPIIIDKLNCQTFKNVHISEAVRTNDLRGIGLINNK